MQYQDHLYLQAVNQILVYVNDYKIVRYDGEYFRCLCTCTCDIMKYAKVIKKDIDFTDGKKSVYFLVIDNPCNKSDFPPEINRKYFCNKDKLNNEKVYVIDGK